MQEKPRERKSVVDGLVRTALRLGADALEVEYKDGCEEVFAFQGSTGLGIARVPGSSARGAALRSELHALARRGRRLKTREGEYKLVVKVHDSFGVDAFHVELRRV